MALTGFAMRTERGVGAPTTRVLSAAPSRQPRPAASSAAPAPALADVRGAEAALKAMTPALERLTPARPFYLRTLGAERARAVLCLSQAVYYEAALEPLAGQQAVAQTVLNRLRHPDFPKSVCGVVYQGASQPTGCQFSFTCDGSRDRPPIQPYWGRARAVAEAALDGFVLKAVGSATYYHADYVSPRWQSQMVKIGQFGSQIFYRFPGALGRVEALTGHYRGGELRVSMAGPAPAPMGRLRNVDYSAGAQQRSSPRAAGQIVFGRRVASREEIAQINARLAALAAATAGPAVAAAQPSAPPASAVVSPGEAGAGAAQRPGAP